MNYQQDMPPPGGYSPITYKRVPLKPGINVYAKLGIMFGVSGLAWVGYHMTVRKINDERIEMRSASVALLPMLTAEVDRMALKQLKRNRDAEQELMKDVKGWEVGKWKGLPVFTTLGPNDYYRPSIAEYYAHSPEKHIKTVVGVIRNA